MSGRVTYARARNGEDVLNVTTRRILGIAGALWILVGYPPGSLSAQGFEELSDSGRRR